MEKTLKTVKLPDIGEGVVEGEVIEWLKQEGEAVDLDEAVVVVMTDKATVELPSPHKGLLAKQYVKVGSLAIVDKPLYDIECESDDISKKSHKPVKKEKVQTKVSQKPREDKVLATPKARGVAKELGVTLDLARPTGKHGEITPEDVRKSLQKTVTYFESDEAEDVVGIKQLMAQKMSESKKTAAHFSYFEQVEATRFIQLKKNIAKEALEEGLKLTYMPFFIKALSLTLKQFPVVNSSYDAEDKKLYIHKVHNIGIAVTTKRGLIVPVLKNVEEMTLTELIHAFDALKKRALTESLTSEDMKGATITISNYGVLGGGGLWATPIINVPEAAILAVNKIQKQPLVKDDQLVVCDSLNLSWSFDHRVVDGDLAARFSHAFAQHILNPAGLC